MTKFSTSSQQNETGLTEWEMRMAKLVGLDESSDLEETEDTIYQPEYEAIENHNQQTLSNNPFAKAALVGAGTLAIVMFAGGFLSQLMSHSEPQLSQNVISKPTPPQPKVKPRLQQLEEEIEGLKTKLALSEQLEAVKAAQQTLRMQKPKSPTPKIAAKPTPAITVARSLNTPTPINHKPQTPVTRTVYVPKVIRVDRIVNPPQPKPQPRSIPTPVIQKPIPPALPIAPPPEPPITQQPLVEIAPPLEPKSPMQEWTRLAKLGSYGQVSINNNSKVSNGTSSPRVEVEREFVNKESPALAERKSPAPIAKKVRDRNLKQVLVGSSARATLVTAIYGETTQSESEDNNLYVLRLKQPLKAADGTAALAKGSQIIAKVSSISENGLMQMEIVKLMKRKNGKLVETRISPDALMIRGKGGKPLVAKQYRKQGSSTARRDAQSFVLGGLGKAAELINRTESEVVTGENGTVAVTNVNRNPSLGAGILEGGMRTVVPQINRRNQRAISRMSRRTNIWFLAKGKELEVFVNQETQF